MIRALTIFFLITVSTIASAQEVALNTPKTIICKFPNGTTGFVDKNRYDTKLAQDNSMTYTFDSINTTNKSARIIGNMGASDVFVDTSPAGLTFIETTLNGGRIYTTVFLKTDQNGNFYATSSRHVTIGGNPSTSQWYGTCKITDFN